MNQPTHLDPTKKRVEREPKEEEESLQGYKLIREKKEREEHNAAVFSENGVSLVEMLGKGAFGEVWKGEMNDKKVAIKFLQGAGDDDIKELIEETSLLG